MSDALISSGTPASVKTSLGSLLPSGTKMLCGTTPIFTSPGTSLYNVVYPVPFSSVTRSAVATVNGLASSCFIYNQSNAGFTIKMNSNVAGTWSARWIAVGN